MMSRCMITSNVIGTQENDDSLLITERDMTELVLNGLRSHLKDKLGVRVPQCRSSSGESFGP